ncbi:DNA methyltransferase [Burkholderia multivorans]|uniref:DNA methyltransferase n=1 Tax=Burkholderia multivorans TaxID=87883 RepID=UPI002ED3D6A4
MSRLVFETSEGDKAALAAALQPVGKTFTDWFEEQLVETISPQQAELVLSCVPDAIHAGDLADSQRVAEDISNADWAFADDDTRFLTHDVHPYPAKYIPQIPANFIRRLSLPGELVLDPFGGSGTTATEAVRLGRRALSVDANPLATLIGKVKTAGISDEDRRRLERLAVAAQTYALDTAPAIDAATIRQWVPDIPNLEKWFSPVVVAELACIRRLIGELTDGRSRDIALLAMSRIIVRVSNQDSETRYVAKDKGIAPRFTIRAFVDSLQGIQRRVEQFSGLDTLGEARFFTADSRHVMADEIATESVGLIVTSPPYPNATDYHLYHRFRIFWLGFDPRALGQVEIGSHLKHQRKRSGFEEYIEDMTAVLHQCHSVLMPGRYAVFVVGDAVFDGETIDTAEGLASAAQSLGFEHVATVERPIHATRRSFSSPARRARSEKMLVLRKPDRMITFSLAPTNYKLWDYEEKLRELEVKALFNGRHRTGRRGNGWTQLDLGQEDRWKLNRLTFSSAYSTAQGFSERTWQKLLENGDSDASKRKEPKYATHGVHAYKGKFYPQLAKSLLNVADIAPEATVLDPFCGSGTVLLEGFLNGFRTHGCDMNPLAVKISRAKTEVITLPQRAVARALDSLSQSLQGSFGQLPDAVDQFHPDVVDELFSWFPAPVVRKLNWLLTQIRLFGEARLVNFLEVLVSDCIREVSQQDPTDLRIRRRAEPIEDAPLIELFRQRLETQQRRLDHFWSVASRRPVPFISANVAHGDCRAESTFSTMGLNEASVDAVVTSPPYATALPYIDTDRLSLMAILGMPSGSRRVVEERLTGSREIPNGERAAIEELLFSKAATEALPKGLISELRNIHRRNVEDGAGFRRLNMPALLYRYFTDMKANLANVSKVLRPGARAFYVVGDSKTKVGDEWFPIRTTEWLMRIGESNGLRASKLLDISVTKENFKHIRHAITENAILVFEK